MRNRIKAAMARRKALATAPQVSVVPGIGPDVSVGHFPWAAK